MSGRVGAVAKQPVFNLMRHRLGLQLGLVTLAASIISNLITCAAEIGGLSLILNYLTGAPYFLMAAVTTLGIVLSIWVLPFKWIERVYGLLGLFMITFAAALIAIHPPWSKVAGGFVPSIPHGLTTKEFLTFGYFCVAIVSAVMFPYEVYSIRPGGSRRNGARRTFSQTASPALSGWASARSSLSQSLPIPRNCSGPPMSIPKFRAAPRSRPRSRSASGA